MRCSVSRRAESLRETLCRAPGLVLLKGNVQKYLITADQLTAESWVAPPPHLSVGGVTPPVFHYGATGTIESHLSAGVVTIPCRYTFALPSCVPQIWHEVGVRVLYRL